MSGYSSLVSSSAAGFYFLEVRFAAGSSVYGYFSISSVSGCLVSSSDVFISSCGVGDSSVIAGTSSSFSGVSSFYAVSPSATCSF